MKKEKIESKFLDYREHLVTEAINLASYIAVYQCIEERRKDRLDQLNIAPGFFQTVLQTLFTTIIVWVNNIYDEKSEAGLHKFLKFIESNITIFSIKELKRRRNYPDDHWMLEREEITKKIIQSDIHKIKQIKSLPSFKTRRDKFHAHFDKNFSFDRKRINKEAPLSWDDLDEVINIFKEVLNRYSSAFDGHVNSIFPINATDLDDLLNKLYIADKNELR